MDLKGQVGANDLGIGDGATDRLRLGKTGEVIRGLAHGQFYESASRGFLFNVSTPVAGVAPGTVFSTTPPIALWNPPNSGIYLAVNKIIMGYISGTLGPGQLSYGQAAQPNAPTGGTELVSVSCLIGSGTRSRCRAFQGSTIATTPTLIRPAFQLGAFAGGTGNIEPPVLDLVMGSLVVAPGNVLVVQGQAGAGTTPLVLISACFEEVPQS